MEPTVDIGIQFGAAVLMLLACVVTHAIGLEAIGKLFRLEEEGLERRRSRHIYMLLAASLAIALFTIHALEIWLFAAFYIAIGALKSWESALFESASSYATLGFTTVKFPADWHLLVAFEGVIGFLLIGWSTAFIVTSTDKLKRG
jgi:hypothetical protein